MKPNLSLTTILLLVITTTKSEGMKPFDNMLLPNNPGINYEYTNEVRLIKTKWNIVISLDFTSLKDKSEQSKEDLKQALYNCKTLIGEFMWDRLIPSANLKHLIKLIKITYNELNTIFVPKMKENTIKLPTDHLIKKRAPLELIGWASKKLFGTMDADDRDELNSEINKFYNTTQTLSYLQAKQTHIVRSNLEELHREMAKNEKYHNYLSDSLKQIQNDTEKLSKEEKMLEDEMRIETWINTFESV